ncbi:antibiotic biosynthesis monooxygenase family protein [Streptomyces sp. Tu 3180]|uniref:antibiotic biosynthesis monooxygenase family protein n=1 Tax=Streptomyces sp. Tu 3180 TaxID=2682611 RepID=UPI00135C10AE|nr:antibiotic biosynthesis monooxygenase family protein [Streptomyces sp. Tu 3180]KAF3469372.1 antibiotic biosynthesis monooxygenase [Streptomyces sp. Tu 3180]
MPTVSVEDNHLTVLNLFTTDAPEKQESLVQEMTKIVNAAAYEGWMSSTVHAGVDSPGTANFIQWRSGEDLEKRYQGEEFKHRTLPVFGEITTSIRLLQNEIAYTLTADGPGSQVTICPHRGNYTVIAVHKVQPGDQDELIDALGPGQAGIVDAPGFRGHVVLRGLRARGLEGSFVVSYAQWESKEAYDAHRDLPEEQWPEGRRKAHARISAVTTEVDVNTYQVVLTRSADDA